MSRKIYRGTTVVPAHEKTVTSFTVTCDFPQCGQTFDRDDHATNEVFLALDPDECVSYIWRKDYCAEHAREIWEKLCAVLGADPDDEGQHGFEEYDG